MDAPPNGRDPAVDSLFRTLDELQGPYVPSGHDMEAKLTTLVGMMPRFPGHFIYVYNYRSGRFLIVRGFEEVLGYAAHEVDLELLCGIVHPEDIPVVGRLNVAVVKAMDRITDLQDLFSMCFSLDYRVRRKDGGYIKVLRQTAVFEVDPMSGKVISTFSLCKDISNIKSSHTVGWEVHGADLPMAELAELSGFRERVRYHPSAREKEVIALLCQGRSSKQVAAELGISIFTVNTHRRNLLERTGLGNTAELVRWAHEEKLV